MEVTNAGIVMEVILVFRNALSPMVSSRLPAANVTVVRLEQSLNALLPMEVTDAGMVTVWKPVPRNASLPMVVTDAGMVRVPVEVILLL
jgi:hypothetical protein